MADGVGDKLPAVPGGGSLVPFGADTALARSAGREPDPGEERDMDLRGLLTVIWSQKWLILSVFSVIFLAVTVYTLTRPPVFEAAANLEVQAREAEIIQGSGVEPVVIADAQHIATQVSLLRSYSLAERVAEKLGLPSNPAFVEQVGDSDARLAAAATKLSQNITVRELQRSRVLQVTYQDTSAELAATIVNAVADEFIASNLERRFNTTASARTFLEERLQSTRAALEDAERRLVSYSREQRVLDLNSSDGSATASDSLDGAALVSLSASLTTAEGERIRAEQRWRAAQGGELPEDTSGASILAQLRQKRAELVAERAELLTRFREEYPAVQQLSGQITSIDGEIANEQQRSVQNLEATYTAALAEERALRVRVAQLQSEVQNLRARSIDYNILSREVDTLRSQYDALLQRYREISISAGIGSSPVSIVDRAVVPRVPVSPSIPRGLLLGAVLGLLAGCGLAVLRNYADDTIKTPEDLRDKLRLPVIGVVPKIKASESMMELLEDPRSPVTEAFTSARVALRYSTSAGVPRSILVTGVKPSEGKTSTVTALGLAFAAEGKRVLIIDADMRRPSFTFTPGTSLGLSGILTGGGQLLENIVGGTVPGLFLLPVGVIPPNPSELLAGGSFGQVLSEATDHFDVVLVDSPPVLGFADAPVMSSHCEATILVIASRSVRRPLAERAMERLLAVRAHLVGGVLTKFDTEWAGYGYGYGYGKQYGYSSKDRTAASVQKEVDERRTIPIFAARGDTGSGRGSAEL